MGAGVLGFDPALLRSIAERVGTPTYVYSANLMRAQYHALQDALKDVPHRICYSVKANGNIGVLKVLKALGAGADIVSVGELRRALAAGFEASSIVFSGVGKTAPELEEAIRAGVGFLNIESSAELDAVIAVARRLKKRASLGIRVNPDVATETHPYTKTGEKTAKFGVPYDEVVRVAQRIAAEPFFTLRGLAMHLGSQITDVEPYHRGAVKLLELVTALRASGITTIEALDVGGGLGVRYHNEKAPSPKAFAEAVAPLLKQAGLALLCEPGRYLVANAGVLLTKVLYRKHAGGKEFVVVDAGMTDFVRPSHYNAHHEIVPLKDGARPEELVNVVGPICESGDFLALDRKLPAVESGEYLAVLGTGAYGFVMSSTYNQRPRPPEVLVEGDRYYVARVREAHVYCEIHPPSRDVAFIRQFDPKGIILSGGPSSVFDPGAPTADPKLLDLGVPLLGICYGMQLVAHLAGGQVKPSPQREYGRAEVAVRDATGLFAGFEPQACITVWASHGDRIDAPPPHFRVTASSGNAPVAAFQHEGKPLYGLLFHPEVAHTPRGGEILHNFLFDICGCTPDWTPGHFIEQEVQRIQGLVGRTGRAICGLSGGVDSAVAAALVHRAIGNRLTCVFVDHGLLRLNEREQVERTFRAHLGIDLQVVDAGDRFLAALAGIEDPEEKRRRIGHMFIDVFEDAAQHVAGGGGGGDVAFLVQGTLYPDVIESSAPRGGPSVTIKTHHNVGGLRPNLPWKLIEPLRELFKDEVRQVGRELGLPEEIVGRHPFPGPGLAIRVLGPVNEARLDLLRRVD